MKTSFSTSRRGPDYVSEELISILSEKATFEFKPLFLRVHANLRTRNAASGGEDMLRLRTYEKLQGLVLNGAVTKVGKEYRGVAAGLARFAAAVADASAKMQIRRMAKQPSGVTTAAPKLTAAVQGRKKTTKTPRIQ
jgi:hypothetical protein